MTKMNEKKWGEVLKGLVGSIFNYEDFESDIISTALYTALKVIAL